MNFRCPISRTEVTGRVNNNERLLKNVPSIFLAFYMFFFLGTFQDFFYLLRYFVFSTFPLIQTNCCMHHKLTVYRYITYIINNMYILNYNAKLKNSLLARSYSLYFIDLTF